MAADGVAAAVSLMMISCIKRFRREVRATNVGATVAGRVNKLTDEFMEDVDDHRTIRTPADTVLRFYAAVRQRPRNALCATDSGSLLDQRPDRVGQVASPASSGEHVMGRACGAGVV